MTHRPETRTLLREGAWTAVGQVGAALGALVSVRILTELLTPGLFGLLMLLIGAAALCQGLAVMPLVQAVSRYYPDYAKAGRTGALQWAASSSLRQSAPLIVTVVSAAGFVYGLTQDDGMWFGVFVGCVFVADGLRSMELTFLNAERRQREVALWSLADAWIRPLGVVVAVTIYGPTVNAILLAYLLASVLLTMVFYGVVLNGRQTQLTQDPILSKELWKYAAPIVPLGLAGWLSGMADRYLIGSMLSLAEAGVYAAAYGLISRPFLMMSAILEMTLRPAYYQKVAERNTEGTAAILRSWFFMALLGGVALVTLFVGFGHIVAQVLLAETYRQSATTVMPWIALGYSLLVLSHVYTRICYAHGATRAVFWTVMTGAAVPAVALWPAITASGIQGAAFTVVLGFGAQLAMAYSFARRWRLAGPHARVGEV